jgi:hypothetical protein
LRDVKPLWCVLLALLTAATSIFSVLPILTVQSVSYNPKPWTLVRSIRTSADPSRYSTNHSHQRSWFHLNLRRHWQDWHVLHYRYRKFSSTLPTNTALISTQLNQGLLCSHPI